MRGYSCIGIVNPKNPLNIGSALRAALIYDAAFLAISGERRKSWRLNHIATDTMSAIKHIPLIWVDDLSKMVPHDCVPIAVDIIEGAKTLMEFSHPERAFYIFGPEECTLGKEITDWCISTVYVPTKGSMNLAASINVVLYDRLLKMTIGR